MTGRDLQWGEETVVVQGLDESVDPRMLPPGACSTLLNCTFSGATSSVTKRPGTALAQAAMGTGAHRLVTHEARNQLLVADLQGSGSQPAALYSALDAPVDDDSSLSERHLANVSNVLVRRSPVASDLQSTVSADCAYVATTGAFGYMVYGLCYSQTGDLVVKVVQVPKDGSASYEAANTVLEEAVTIDGEMYGVIRVARCAPALDRYVLVWFAAVNGIDDISYHGVVVDCGGATPTVGTVYAIDSGRPGWGSYHMCWADACESTYNADLGASVPNWIFAYKYSSTVIKTLRLTTAALVIDWSTSTSASAVEAISCFEYGGSTWLNFWHSDSLAETPAPGWYYEHLDTAAGTSTFGRLAWCVAGDLTGTASITAGAKVSGIGLKSASEVVLFHSQWHDQAVGLAPDVPGFSNRSHTRWRTADNVGTTGYLDEKRGPRLVSKPWKDRVSNYYQAWCDYTSSQYQQDITATAVPSKTALITWSHTPVLMRFKELTADRVEFPTVGRGEPTAQALAAIAPNLLTDPQSVYADTISGSPAFLNEPRHKTNTLYSVTHGTRDNSQTDVTELGRHSCLALRYVPLEPRGAAWDVVVRDDEGPDFQDGYGRMQSATFGGSTYVAGGLLAQWDGDRFSENNFISAPMVGVTTATTGGSWATAWAEKTIYLQAVWETVLANGERVKSATSAIQGVLLDGDAGLGVAPNNLLTVYLEPNTVTLRNYGEGQELRGPRTIVTLYCSSEPDGTALHRILPFDNDDWSPYLSNIDALEPITITFDEGALESNGPATEIQDNEIIYNDSGELDNDPVYGGCCCLTVHKDRLWAGGGDEQDVLWYSKERVDGRPAEFALGQQVRIPGQQVVGLASLDDALIVLCRRGVYAVYGDGPNATGDPASGTFQVVPITVTSGCVSPASVAMTPVGVIYAAESGTMMVNRSRALLALPHVDTSMTARPVASARIVPAQTQVRFNMALATAGDLELADVLVYDWKADKWATWRYTLNSQGEELPNGLIVDQAVLNGRVYLLADDGRVLHENAAYGADCVETVSGEAFAYRQQLLFGWRDFGRPHGYKRVGHWLAMLQPQTWSTYSSGNEQFYPFGFRADFDFNYAESGTTDTSYWTSYRLGGVAAWDGVTRVRKHVSKMTPSIRVTLTEDEPARRITATDSSASVSVGSNTVLRVRITTGSYTALTVTGGTRTKAQIVSDLNRAIGLAGWTDYLLALVNGSSQVVLQVIAKDSAGLGSVLDVDSVANGSTLNSVIGLAAGGVVGESPVGLADQTGFVIQAMTFEVGQAPGSQRVPQAQSK